MKKAMMILAMALTLSAAFQVRAKAPECVKDGKTYGVVEGNFREEWFCYQERGESYLAGECFEPALADFEQAIQLRTGVDQAAELPGCDRRRARSYGMHFLDWFGHRGRGIALYHVGRIDEAVQELETSLQCTESSQAQYYLDKARTEKLKSSGGDTQDPKISSLVLLAAEPKVDFVQEGAPAARAGYDQFIAVPYYFTLDEIEAIKETLTKEQKQDKGYLKSLAPGWGNQVISWKAADVISDRPVREGKFWLVVKTEDDQGVQSVAAAGTRSPYTFAQKTRADVFPLEINAPAGEEVSVDELAPADLFSIPLQETVDQAQVELAVIDLTGKTAKKTLALAIDRQGPQLSVEEAKVLPDGKARIKGVLDDASGVSKFTVGGVSPARVAAGAFEITAPLDGGRLSFEAIDPAGNRTTGVIVFGPRKGTMLRTPFRWTGLWDRLYRVAALDVFDVPTAAFPLRASRLAPWTPELDEVPWSRVNSPIQVAAELELYWNELQSTMGMAPTPPQILLKTTTQTVYTNQAFIEGSAVGQGALLKSVLINGQNVLPGPRSNAFFNKLIYLRPGKNMVKIQAVDENGLTSEEIVALHRVVPRVQAVAERLAVSMLPFYQDPSFVEIGEVAYDNLATSLIQQRRFRYVDRSKVEAAVREIRLSGLGLVDPATATRAGKLNASEAIIIGVVRETPTSIEVKAQVVDVDSSRIMATRDAFHQDKSLSNLQFITQGLAVKLKNAFPIVQGNIASSEGKSMNTDLGASTRVIPGMRVVFFKVIPKTDASGEPVGADTEKIGEGKIVSVASKGSSVQVIQASGEAKANDLVITK